jgi:hypothetical protein
MAIRLNGGKAKTPMANLLEDAFSQYKYGAGNASSRYQENGGPKTRPAILKR